MADSYNIEQVKKSLVEAMKSHRCNISKSCEAVGVQRSTFYSYLKEDPAFKQAIEDCTEASIDHVEDRLMDNIDGGDTGSICFYLKCKAKHRGYIERSEYRIGQDADAPALIPESLVAQTLTALIEAEKKRLAADSTPNA
ncbi:MAG: hypothetical protein WC734_06065 [Patescibacteria group bacterium]|jgi:hypothetical protein